jgi:alkylresorcinol/alkylpyrone synthase
MSVISAVGTAVPPYGYDQGVAKEFGRALFQEVFPEIDRLLAVFNHASIDRRHFSVPKEWFESEHSFADKNRLYNETALEVGKAAVLECLEAARLRPGDVDHFIFVSTTGLATPSIDARLINILKMRNDVCRTPIWGLGCAGGAAGLSRAFEYTRAFPRKRALVLALELCGLTFQRNDLSKSNLVGVSLFADGAAAAMVEGTETEANGPRILGGRSMMWYDSLDVMGWEINDQGLKVIFSRDIPAIVRTSVLPNILEFLRAHGLSLNAIRHLVAHPGGAKVLEAYEQTLQLTDGQLDHSRNVLRHYGNMSSPTVLFVLKEFLCSGEICAGDYGLVTALGPGFSSEMILIQG